MKSLATIFIVTISMVACHPQNKSKDELATAFGHKLYQSDISTALSSATSALDSLQITNKYVDNWLMSEILYNEAKKELSNEKSITNLVYNYKKSLYIHELEKKKLLELDTASISAQIMNSINRPDAEFVLDEAVVRFLLVKVREEEYNDTLKAIWKTEDLPALDIYVKQVGGLALIEVDKWYHVSELNTFTPAEFRNKINFSKSESYSLNQDGEEFLLKVLEHREAGEQEPQELTIPRLRQILLHDKSIQFLKDWKKELYQNNIQNKNIHITNNS